MLLKFEDFLVESRGHRMWDRYQMHRYPDDTVKSAVWDYVSGYTSGVNDNLRQGSIRGCSQVVHDLDQAFGSAYASQGSLDVWRTVDWDYMGDVYGMDESRLDEMVGQVFKNKGYMSTTKLMKSPWGDRWSRGDVVMHIVCEGECSYLDINKIFDDDEIDCKFQEECLLPRGVEMELESYELKKGKQFYKEGTWVLEMRIK